MDCMYFQHKSTTLFGHDFNETIARNSLTNMYILSANILNNSSIIIIDNSNNMSGVNGNKVYIISSSLCKVKSYNESHLLCVIVINSSMFVFLIFLTKINTTTKHFSNDTSTLHKSLDSRHT